MRHYEICFIVHPDQSEQVARDDRPYKLMITNNKAQFTASKIGVAASWRTRSTSLPKPTTC